jgi:hypothetical protein
MVTRCEKGGPTRGLPYFRLLPCRLPGSPASCSATTPGGSHTAPGRRAAPGQRSGSTLGRRRSGTGAHFAVPQNAAIAAAGSAHRAGSTTPCSTTACRPRSSAARPASATCTLRQGWTPGQCNPAGRRDQDLRKACHDNMTPCLATFRKRCVPNRVPSQHLLPVQELGTGRRDVQAGRALVHITESFGPTIRIRNVVIEGATNLTRSAFP